MEYIILKNFLHLRCIKKHATFTNNEYLRSSKIQCKFSTSHYSMLRTIKNEKFENLGVTFMTKSIHEIRSRFHSHCLLII